ncbi:MAG: hypothetical protein GY924_21990, partial [Planctomycetaceae bacterium]|nr:hypothetical protein [Planctomycetaceae bacterium]
LVGQDILYNGVSASFQSDYLKLASFTSDVRNLSQYVGVSGSSISDGMNLSFSLPSDFSADWSDSLSPASGAEGVFYRNSVNSDAQPFNTIGYGGEDFRVVFMAAPFEGISTSAGDPNNQAFVMDKVVEFLMPPVTATGDVVVSAPSSSGVTTEAGDSVSFTVVLTEAPVSDVSFSVASSDSGEGTVDVAQLTFTPGNWDSAQTVTVTGVDDSLVDGDVGYSIVLGVADTTDSNYSGLDPADVSLSNADNDVAGLSLNLGAGSVSEGSTLVGVVSRNTDTSSALVVTLVSDDSNEASVSNTVTIGAGSSSAQFVITGVEDSFVDGDQQVSIAVSSSGYTGASGDVTVVDTTALALSLSLADSVISESGGATTGTVTRNSTGEAVSLTILSSDVSEVEVGTLTILANEMSGTFTLTAQDDSLVDGDQAVTISVDATGYLGDSASLTVADDEVALLTISIASPEVAEGSSTTGTITRNTGTSGALVVNLGSSDADEAAVSSSVTIPDGQSSVDFTISGVADGLVDGSQPATITGTATGFESGTGSVTVLDVDSPTLTLNIAETEVAEDGSVTATVSRNTDISTALQVELETSDSTAATVPLLVTIAAGQSSVTFDVTGVDDSVVDGDQVAVITAAVTGFAEGSDSIIVVDNDVAAITLVIAEDSISEAGGTSVATLSRNTLTSSSLIVALTSSDASEVAIPQEVTIPVGFSSVTFTINAVDDSDYDGNQNVVITASSSGFVSGVDSLQVIDDDPPPPNPEILFVDDDQGASYERFYTAALDANSLQYDSWQVSSQGLPGTADLSDYDVVIWNTGFEYSATGSGLASAEQIALSGYLDGGGGLFLVGQDILYNGVSASFQSDYLKLASFTSDVRNLSQYVGVSGSSISDGM